MQLQLVFKYKKYKRNLEKRINSVTKENNFPMVTLQLPLFNERYVAERLIDAVLALDYPKDKLEIQILDDSTDDTTAIIQKKLDGLGSDSNIKLIRRPNREGFKAGALAYGLEIAEGELIAIFDADFIPKADFLKKMIPNFQNAEIGMVQSRWEHLNENHSMLTKMQAFALDAHFSVEQGGRNAGNHFINFNGTAGVWRKKAIEEGGGWQSDTLTEDLDLSYRAQLKGWKFLFVEEVGAPAELPAEMNALKNQQFRWNKGAAECTRKNLKKVLKDATISFPTKVNAVFHLMNSAVFICIVILAVLSLPMLVIKHEYMQYNLLFKLASIFLITLPILALFYWYSESRKEDHFWKRLWSFVYQFPAFLSISMGMSLHNAVAVLEGYFGKKSAFIRTPKFNLLDSKKSSWVNNSYLKSKISWTSIAEVLLVFYFLGAILLAFKYQDFALLPFHLMLFLGFLTVSYYTISHSLKIRS